MKTLHPSFYKRWVQSQRVKNLQFNLFKVLQGQKLAVWSYSWQISLVSFLES